MVRFSVVSNYLGIAVLSSLLLSNLEGSNNATSPGSMKSEQCNQRRAPSGLTPLLGWYVLYLYIQNNNAITRCKPSLDQQTLGKNHPTAECRQARPTSSTCIAHVLEPEPRQHRNFLFFLPFHRRIVHAVVVNYYLVRKEKRRRKTRDLDVASCPAGWPISPSSWLVLEV